MQTFEKNYRNYKLLGTDSVIKKFKKNFVTLLVLLRYIVLALLYYILCICNQISSCDMI